MADMLENTVFMLVYETSKFDQYFKYLCSALNMLKGSDIANAVFST